MGHLPRRRMMMIVLLLLVSQHASGVEVYEGVESVLLPCQVPADVSRSSTSAVWDREEFRNPTVHRRLQSIDDLSGQNDRYTNRTSMFTDALQTGDLSLTLRNPTVSDSGTYTCITLRFGDRLSQTEVQLKVSVPPPVWPLVLSAVLGTLIILAAAFGLFVCHAYVRMKKRSEDLQPEVVEAPQGEESVLLPFKPTADLPQDVTVEWTHNNMKVHVYKSGNNQPDKQDQGYSGRTEMNKDPLRTKDLSLTLEHLHLTDSGVYTCTIKKDGVKLLQKSVTLSVTVPQPEKLEVAGVRTVQLPFKTTADLPQDVTVEWRHSDYNYIKVHVNERGKNKPDKQDQGYRGHTNMKKKEIKNKDFSLTLKHLRLTDSGVYTCTIYNKDGHMLLQKSVTLSVRSLQKKVLEVTEGDESVLLAFKFPADLPQDVTVEWTHNNMKVHVYESGNNQPDKQDQDYRGRTQMNEDPLNTKDLSLTLKDLHLTDSGVYTCTVYNKHGHMLLRKSVTLRVRVPQPKMVEVTQEEESVLLPFKTTAVLPQDVTVEWRHSDYNYVIVHLYESGNKQPVNQDQYHRGRTEMKKDPLKTKDLSLTLKDLHLTDSGVYTCTIYNKDGDKLLQKSLILNVTVEAMTVTQGVKSVLLPFKTTAVLPQDVTVEWTHNYRKVHVYESGNNQPVNQDQGYRGRTEMNEEQIKNRDFSLTLKNLHLTDSGDYTCTIKKDGHMLLQKSMRLSVRALEPTIVKMTEGVKSVLLPFKTTADLPQDVTVEWTYYNIKLHVYESGNNQPDKQSQSYNGFTEMDEDPLRTKDFSLTLKYPYFTDSGVYTCTVYNKDGYKLLQKSVTLYFKDAEMQMVVTQGLKFVMLPFKIPHDLPQDVTVEWKHNYVTVYKYIDVNVDSQHQDYSGRTEMNKDALKTKDLSLTLKDLHLTDSGVYTCTVYKDGHMLLQKSVTLCVTALEPNIVTVTEGEDSVLLLFKTTADLPQDVTVEWTHNNMKVHVYESGNNQPDKQDQDYRGRTEMNEDPLKTKDLSLTLKDLHLTDSGVYTCTVYNKDGHMLLQKSVTLSVKATLMGTMAEMFPHCLCYRQRSVQRAQSDQEHRNRNHEDVPLMDLHRVS
ncbi:uncharacterized protein LOC134624313 [Pelmatolapia mariae]|uniref:uncharacterized protein LOC134624313 n=1 Tax=Pelmatolapia mariae TaxID=158779 RepID=UPI002FE51CA0